MRRIYISGLLIMVCLLLGEEKICAKTINTGLITEPLPEERLEYVSANYSELAMMDQMPEGMRIECFDVNDQGLVAIGSAGVTSPKYIGIYDAKGVYQYGYICAAEGSYALEWDGDNLLIYLGKAGLLLSVNTEGTVESILGVEYDSPNSAYIRDVLLATEKTYDNMQYKLCNKQTFPFIDGSPYTQLIAVDANKEEKIIYDANYNPMPYVIFGVCFALFMFLCLVLNFKVRKDEESEELL